MPEHQNPDSGTSNSTSRDRSTESSQSENESSSNSDEVMERWMRDYGTVRWGGESTGGSRDRTPRIVSGNPPIPLPPDWNQGQSSVGMSSSQRMREYHSSLRETPAQESMRPQPEESSPNLREDQMPNSIPLWKLNNYSAYQHKLRLYQEDTRSSIRIIIEPAGSTIAVERTILRRITKQNLTDHFGINDSTWGFLAQQIKGSYVSRLGYLDYLKESENGEPWHTLTSRPKLSSFAEKVFLSAKNRWGFCTTCSLLGHNTDEIHEDCDGCSETARHGGRTTISVITSPRIGDNLTIMHLCYSCRADPAIRVEIRRCTHCSRWMHNNVSRRLSMGVGSVESGRHAACPGCYAAAETCERCGRQSLPRDINTESQLCNVCIDTEREEGTVRAWNFKPLFIFHPGKTEIKGKFYVGLEVEVSFGSGDLWDARSAWVRNLPRGLMYVKSDSSVRNGWEVVTHPMQPDWALKFFPFDLFDELKGFGALDTHESCGTHAHINKSAFTTAHLWKFMQIHYRLPKFCQVAGGRGSTTFASFLDNRYLAQKTDIIRILKNKEEAMSNYGRTVALNFSNKDTIEVRYMAGGSTGNLVRKNLEWIKALIDFSDEVTINQINKGVIDNAGYFLGWIYDHTAELPNLAAWMSKELPTVLEMPEGSN